jgi:hypothetical protein
MKENEQKHEARLKQQQEENAEFSSIVKERCWWSVSKCKKKKKNKIIDFILNKYNKIDEPFLGFTDKFNGKCVSINKLKPIDVNPCTDNPYDKCDANLCEWVQSVQVQTLDVTQNHMPWEVAQMTGILSNNIDIDDFKTILFTLVNSGKQELINIADQITDLTQDNLLVKVTELLNGLGKDVDRKFNSVGSKIEELEVAHV